MVQFNTLVGLLPLLASATASVLPRQASPKPIYSLQGSWFENIAVRPNGNLLLTRMDRPELWQYDFATNQGALLVTFPDASAATGIAELTPDVWAVVAGRYSMGAGTTPGSWTVHKVDLSSGDSAAAATSLVAQFPESGNFNGLAGLNATHVLPGDTLEGAVYMLDTATGDYSLLKADASMKPGAIPFGIDGMKVHDGALYYSNIATSSLYRLGLDSGAIEKLPAAVQGDDFAFGSDGLLYLATNTGNSVVKIDVTKPGSTRVGAAQGSTAVAFGRREGVDEGTLYVVTSGGQVIGFDVL